MPRGLLSREEGSLPLALLAAIIVAGMIGALMVRMVGSEGAVRFDRDFAESLQVADVGVNRALFALNEDATIPGAASPGTATVDGITYEWWGDEVAPRRWDVISVATTPGGVSRRVEARIEERSLFFPGAFGDRLVALQGTSTEVDSYNSAVACPVGVKEDTCGWGTSPDFGTQNGSIGTNDVLKFNGNVPIREQGAFLYDYLENPPTPSTITTNDPFGDRCDVSGNTTVNLCTETYVRAVDEKLDLASQANTAFIREKFESGGGCADPTSDRYVMKHENKHLKPYKGATAAGGIPDPTSSSFDNYYCKESWDITEDVRLHTDATPQTPVVVFVRDYFKITQPNVSVACFSADGTKRCDAKTVEDASERTVRPPAARLQIYVLGESNNVSLKSNSMFAGVIYAPLSKCGGDSTGAGTDIYGSVMCGEMQNIGNWRFHYDDALGLYGSGVYNVAFWYEEPPGT